MYWLTWHSNPLWNRSMFIKRLNSTQSSNWTCKSLLVIGRAEPELPVERTPPVPVLPVPYDEALGDIFVNVWLITPESLTCDDMCLYCFLIFTLIFGVSLLLSFDCYIHVFICIWYEMCECVCVQQLKSH